VPPALAVPAGACDDGLKMLVGRDVERALIGELIEGAHVGTASTLVLSGDPGIGKTALLEYAVEQAQRMTVIRALGVETEAELEFSALHELCNPLLDVLTEIPERQAEALRGALGIASVEIADQFTIGAATLSLLAAAAEKRPLLAVIDDAQWLDRSSADALVFASRRLKADRVCVLFACRTGDERTFAVPGTRSLTLSGLAKDDAAKLLGPEQASPAVAERLVEATGGNPLALAEMPRLLSRDQLAGRKPLPDPVPAGTVERALRQRVEVLPEATQEALLLASCSASRNVDVILLALARVGLDLTALEGAEDAGVVLVAHDKVEFRHPLIRSAIYHGALPSGRRAGHRAFAEALTGGDRFEERTWHLAAAALGPDEEIAAALETTATEAIKRSGYPAAASALQRAADLTPADDTRLRRLYEAAKAAWEGGRTELALQLLQAPLERCSEPRLRSRIVHLRYLIERLSGSVVVALESLTVAAELVAAIDPEQAVAILVDAAEAAVYAADVDAALVAASRARELAPADGAAEDIIADLVLGEALLYAGRAPEANERISRAAGALERHAALRENPRMVARLAFDLTTADRLAEARPTAARAVSLAREQGATSALCYALDASAWNALHAGRWRDAYAAASEGSALARETGQANTLLYMLCELAWIEAGRGQDDACRAHAHEAVELADANQLRFAGMFARMALALLDLGRGRLEQAVTGLRGVDKIGRQVVATGPDEFPWADLCEALVRLDRPDEARESLETPGRFARVVRGERWTAAVSRRCEGLLADEDAFAPHFEQALTIHESAADAFQLARTHLCYGERLRRSGRRIQAREQLRQALELFDRLEARPWYERTRRELQASGEKLRRHEPWKTEELTPQELQIALQVADGKTNKEVGAALFLSPKTVEYHLTHVYRKLDLHSRAQLILLFASEGTMTVSAP
jgi:DNA-binding CsgD family transcriptional regulator